MPLADFAGKRNWGYDGVLPLRAGLGLRPARGPEGADRRRARRRADGAARRGLQPLRPEGQLPAALRAAVLHRAHNTPWGAAIDFSNDVGAQILRPQRALLARGVPLRRPALRRGARHHRRVAAPHPRRDLRLGARRQAPGAGERRQPGALPRPRPVHRAVERRLAPRLPRARHRRVATATTSSYADAPAKHLARCLAEGFAYQGEVSPFSKEQRGEPSAHLPPSCFVDFMQNHDQIGNRAFGERIAVLARGRAS